MNPSGKRNLLAGAVFAMLVHGVTANAQTPDHQYSTADIEGGSGVYGGRWALCRGPRGENVAGVNLGRQQFRKPLSDDELRQVITGGVAANGMPGFKFQPKELDGLVA